MIYRVKKSIFSLRELEHKIKEDLVFRYIVNLHQVPNDLTLSLKSASLKRHIYPWFMLCLLSL